MFDGTFINDEDLNAGMGKKTFLDTEEFKPSLPNLTQEGRLHEYRAWLLQQVANNIQPYVEN